MIRFHAESLGDMGISPGAVTLLATTLHDAKRSGRVITFGVQKVHAGLDEARKRLARAGIAALSVDARARGRISQEVLFRMLGYDEIESLDYFPIEKPTYVHDLNLPVPAALNARFDLVYDGGTTEHCFSVPAVLSNAVNLARCGGRVIHHLPLNNWVDHGFYQFSPCLFFDFYEANGFQDLRMLLHFMSKNREAFIAYDPRRDDLPYGFGGRAQILAFFTAIKARELASVVFPIQGRYRRAFGEAAGHAPLKGKPSQLARLRRSILKRSWSLRAKRC